MRAYVYGEVPPEVGNECAYAEFTEPAGGFPQVIPSPPTPTITNDWVTLAVPFCNVPSIRKDWVTRAVLAMSRGHLWAGTSIQGPRQLKYLDLFGWHDALVRSRPAQVIHQLRIVPN